MGENGEVLKHLTETIKALASMAQSLQTLQDQVKEHSSLIVEAKSNNILTSDKIDRINSMLFGDGSVEGSITSKIVKLSSDISSLSKTLDEMKQGKIREKSNSLAWNILIITVISGVFTAILSGSIPTVIEMIKKLLH